MLSLPYPKIETVFPRDDKTHKVDQLKWRDLAFASIDSWIITEKVDGTNIRLHFYVEPGTFNLRLEIGGRTDEAQIQKNLLPELEAIAAAIGTGVSQILEDHDLNSLTIYGEGYGAGIQKGGGRYRQDPGFIVFDMMVDNKSWLTFDQVRKNCHELKLEAVPSFGLFDVDMVADSVRAVLKSEVADDATLIAEGVVAQPLVPLYDGRGKRVMWKLKHRDF